MHLLFLLSNESRRTSALIVYYLFGWTECQLNLFDLSAAAAAAGIGDLNAAKNILSVSIGCRPCRNVVTMKQCARGQGERKRKKEPTITCRCGDKRAAGIIDVTLALSKPAD